MMMILSFIFWSSICVILHTYVLYPVILYFLSKNKKENDIVYGPNDDLPSVAVVMAVYNEEAVIREKLTSIFQTNYPLHLIDVYVGSDNSNDETESIVAQFAEKYPQVHLVHFDSRTGKPQIINALIKSIDAKILLLTDANVYFEENTIFELVKHFKNDAIDAVGALIKNNNEKSSGISVQEKTYLTQDSDVKYREGLFARAVIGLFGGLYAIRRKSYRAVPQGFIVDDFYITMSVIENGGGVITANDSVCYEDVSNNITEEFKRKTRISTGNFMNLSRFRRLSNPFTKVGFMFLSHKIFRWITPFLLILVFVLNVCICTYGVVYQITLCGQLFLLLLLLCDRLLGKFNIHCGLLRFVTHFYAMNAALLLGFWNYLKKDSTSVWQPTKRNQE